MIPSKPSIGTKLALIFVAFTFLPFILIGVGLYKVQEEQLLASTEAKLNRTADLIEHEIEEITEHNLQHLTLVSRIPQMRTVIASLVQEGNRSSLRVKMRKILSDTIGLFDHIDALLLLHPETGEVLASTHPDQEGKYFDKRPYFKSGKEKTTVSRIHYSLPLERNIMVLASPVRSGDHLEGVLVAWTSIGHILDSVSRKAEAPFYLVTPQHFYAGALTQEGDAGKIRSAVFSKGAEEGLAGRRGSAVYKDYRGTTVIGAYIPVASLDMALLVEEPLATVLGSARQAGRRSLFLTGFLAVLLLAGTLALSRRALKPLRTLRRALVDYGEGHLEGRIPSDGGSPEMDQLIGAFNQMMDSRRESEDRYKILVENVGYGVTLIDRNHRVLMTNPTVGSLLHKDPASFVGGQCFKEFHNRNEICPECPGIQALESGRPAEVVKRGGMGADGSPRTVRIRAFPFPDASGHPAGFIEVVEDVTDRLKSERSLAEEKERLAVTLRSIGDGVITTDTAGRVVLMNRVSESLTGWSQEEAAGRPLEEVFRLLEERSRLPLPSPVKGVLEMGEGTMVTRQAVLVGRTGRQLQVSDSVAPIRDRESTIIGAVLVFRDVTERNRLEAEVIKGKKLESLGVLAGGIAHDFNNILSAVMGNISLAALLTGPDHEAAQLLRDAELGSLRARDLTQQLLTFSRGGDPILKTASIGDIIRQSTTFVLRGRGVTCRYNIPEDLWFVDIDKGQMSQVIQNLAMNACQAMPGGGVIDIACENVERRNGDPPLEGERFVKIVFKDNGIGIPESLLDRIFDPYFTTKQQGSGLGLAITFSIVTRHGGHIRVESKTAEGTTFIIFLPAATKVSAQEPEAGAIHAPVKGEGRVLVMDDEPMVQTMAKNLLQHIGYEVAVAEEGSEAVALYKSAYDSGRRFDAVILDLTVPGGMGGREAAREILKVDPEARLIVSSGYSTDPVISNFRAHGFANAVVKPYRAITFSKVLSEVIGR